MGAMKELAIEMLERRERDEMSGALTDAEKEGAVAREEYERVRTAVNLSSFWEPDSPYDKLMKPALLAMKADVIRLSNLAILEREKAEREKAERDAKMSEAKQELDDAIAAMEQASEVFEDREAELIVAQSRYYVLVTDATKGGH